ncbi:MAG: hypothetical protein JWO88_2573, partial [Frankiales bacterium]|nr:hypothetical protein [Frankiales bacterium]
MASVDLYWLPLGAGPKGQCVRFNGRVFEGISSFLSRRNPHDLYHSALDVRVDGDAYVI